MGVDKAWIGSIDDPLASQVARALLGAGCESVLLVGGDGRRAAAAGWEWIPDHDPGAGPLGGVVTASLRHRHEPLLVAACDLPDIDAADLTPLVAEVMERGADVAAFDLDGRTQWSATALSARATDVAVDRFRSGERSMWRTFTSTRLVQRRLEPARPDALADADRPEDLPERLRPPRSTG